MDATQWGKEEESSEVGMIQMSTAVVDPGTMVIHLHHTPEKGEEATKFKKHLIMLWSNSLGKD